jgi:hypothetical protein
VRTKGLVRKSLVIRGQEVTLELRGVSPPERLGEALALLDGG